MYDTECRALGLNLHRTRGWLNFEQMDSIHTQIADVAPRRVNCETVYIVRFDGDGIATVLDRDMQSSKPGSR
jgi:hypothetical protein